MLPLVVRYIKLIYSWSVHPARRAHSMASSSTSESDSLPVSSACKAQRWYESQSRQLNNEGEIFFPRFARTDQHYAPLCTAASPNTKLLPTALYNMTIPPSTFLDLPLCTYTYTATDSTISKNVRQFSSWLPPLAKKVMYSPGHRPGI